MVSYRYNRQGQLTGYTKSSKDIRNEALGSIGVLAICLVLIALLPIWYPALFVFAYLINQLGWHPLFAGFVGLGVIAFGLWLLWRFWIFRAMFFGIETIALTYFVYTYALPRTDVIWASFFALLALCLGTLFTWFVAIGLRDD